jgi:hypothetical protein
MSRYGNELELIGRWVKTRTADLKEEWGNEIYEAIGGSPYAFEVEVRIDDAASRQAHAECLAYLRGEPVPDAGVALAELIDWIGKHDCSPGGGDLPMLPSRRTNITS